MKYFRALLLIFISTFNLFLFSFGQTDNTRPFEFDFTREAILLGAGTAAAITSLIIFHNVQPLTVTEINSIDHDDINEFDRDAIGSYQEDQLGDVLLYSSYTLPLTFMAISETRGEFEDLALMYAEVLLLNTSITTIVKGVTQRVRPYVYDNQSPWSDRIKKDSRLSFYSGHSSTTASNYFFTAKVFDEYLTNSTTKVLIWSAAALIPAITSFSRVNTHNHFPTDVIVGYITGAVIGYLIPLIHKRENESIGATDLSKNIYKPLIGFKINF
jgi:membrane-associated phospholipid phosphatase